VLVGFDEPFLRATFGEVTRAATLDNGLGVDNEEQGTPVWVGRDLRGTWPEVWPTFRRLG
jgi:hypothetical protein